jgi:3-deoxy-D-manno-octulosonic-acid transferase
MMTFLYNIGIWLFHFSIKIAAFFNPKAKLWLEGRNDIFNKIQADLNPKPHTRNPKPETRIWIHVASLGEFEQGRPIIEQLKSQQATGDRRQVDIILTFFSPSGYEIRKNYPLADHVFYLPLDTAANAKQFLDIVKPDVAIFVKYEFWFHYLTALKKRNIPTLLVSGIFRAKQFSKFNPYSYFLKRMLGSFTHFFIQTPPSVFLLKKQGFDNVTLAGDTRIDRVASLPQEGRTFPLIEKFVGHSPVFICGSTWQADETLILPLLEDERFKNWKFIFAPHDIAENNIKRLEKSLKTPVIRYSLLETRYSLSVTRESLLETQNAQLEIQTPKPETLIIDNVGMLSALYRYGRVAYIGGGFGKGIHNTLEPIAFRLPVIFGMKYQKFEEAIRLLETGGGFSVTNSEDLLKVMLDLSEKTYYIASSKAAESYVLENRGATGKIIDFLKS